MAGAWSDHEAMRMQGYAARVRSLDWTPTASGWRAPARTS